MSIDRQEATRLTTLSTAVAVELATRVTLNLSGGIIADRVNDAPLNKEAVSGLISSKLNTEMLAKAEKVQ